MTDAMRIGGGNSDVCSQFCWDLRAMQDPIVLEWGTLRADPEVPTHHRAWTGTPYYLMADVAPGPDVDVVHDAHVGYWQNDHEWMIENVFGAIIAVSVWEHLARPWVAAQHLAKALRPGGIAYISTHHTFPDHGYPNDYTRWSQSGLRELFESTGLETVATSYMYPCTITPPDDVANGRWNPGAPAWLVVDGYFRKGSAT